MTKKTSLFGLRFDSDVELNPSPEELRVFLATTVKAGTRLTQGSDLARYRDLLNEALLYEGGHRSDAASQDLREKLFYAAIGHSQFAHAGLELAVGQYKYHLSALQALDLRKPSAFIRAAEAEVARLSAKKKDDAEKRERLLGMLEDRKRQLELLKRRQRALADELGRIGLYVRDNLVRIENLCTASIVVLSDPRILQQEEERMIEGIKERFKDQLKDSLHHGKVSRQDLEAARKDVGVLAQEAASLVRSDMSSVTALLAAVHDHAKEHASAIDRLMPELPGTEYDGAAAAGGPFARLEDVLVSLVSGYRLELPAAALRSETAHLRVLEETRRDLLAHIVTLLDLERRTRNDRRSEEGRRRRREPHVPCTERRSGRDRRSGKSRRSDISDL